MPQTKKISSKKKQMLVKTKEEYERNDYLPENASGFCISEIRATVSELVVSVS